MNILYVEDNPYDADLVQVVLKKCGGEFNLTLARSAKEAIEKINSQNRDPLDLVLCDIHLNDGNGLSILNEVNKNEIQVAVVMVTGQGDEETAITSLKAGAVDYVIKRQNYLKDLPDTLRKALKKYKEINKKRVQRIRVLYGEHNLIDIDMTKRSFQAYAPHIDLEVMTNLEEIQNEITLRAGTHSFDVLLLDYHLPGKNITEFIKDLRETNKEIPVIVTTGQGNEEAAVEIFKLGFTDYIVKHSGYLLRLPVVIENLHHLSLLQKSEKMLLQAYDATLLGWANFLDLRDKQTEGHTLRVLDWTMRAGQKFGLNEREMVELRRGVLLHDIGKVGVPDQILNKPGPLTEDEWLIMKKHTDYASQMLAPILFLKEALNIPYCHHEKWDGSGYPRGLKGKEIPFVARLFAIFDAYDAITSERPYKKARSKEEAIAILQKDAGSHFDPEIMDTCIKILTDN
ncbi:MAG: response regulator [Chloroflexi bacterium]|nr:response regulator [Chloroflexota bacterium]